MIRRVPIIRHDLDGGVIDGTAQVERTNDGVRAFDFRDLDGWPLVLPPGSSFSVHLELLEPSPDA